MDKELENKLRDIRQQLTILAFEAYILVDDISILLDEETIPIEEDECG